MDQMAEVAGVSKPVIYGEFGGRNGVAAQLVLELGGRIEKDVTTALLPPDADPDLGAGVLVLVDSLFRLVNDEPHLYAFMVRALRSSGSGLLDNTLVVSISERIDVLWTLIGLHLESDMRRLVTHSTLGFVFAALDSWQQTHRPARETVVAMLSTFMVRVIDLVVVGELDFGRDGDY